MKTTCTLLAFFALLTSGLSAQFEQVTQGAGYANSIYYDLATGTSVPVAHTEWDIAFNVGGRSSGILINEGVASSQTEPLRQVELYATDEADFATADTAQIMQRLYNGAASWDDGAFNAAANPADPFDLGWGSYSPATQTVFGSRVFFVATRDGAYHKVFVESLAGGEYTFIHGPLDGSSTDTVRIAKEQFVGKTLAYFSFDDGVLDLEPTAWDLLFTRYVTPLSDGAGGILDYTVTGVLQNKEVSIAQVSGVDPQTAVAPTDEAAYSDTLDVIGYEWKSFDLNTFQWSVPDDLVYFVRTPDSLYRLQFIDFEGSSTGVSTFSLNTEGATAIASVPVSINQSRLYPNPAPQRATLEVEARQVATGMRLEIIDPAGRVLSKAGIPDLRAGLNQVDVPLAGLPAGHYFVRLSGSNGVLTHHLIKQ